MQHFGLLNINKPPGMTSRKVVDHVARLVKPAKAGHAGTLDPLAIGVLIVCVGRATRLIGMVQEQRKVYRAKFLLGCRSDTDDIEGNLTEVTPCPQVSRREIEKVLPRFIGRIEQVPPRYSAVHVGGKRAYELARRGEAIELKPRIVEVHQLELIGLSGNELELELECGSGTYVRSIGRDLGELLGCGAVMRELVRTRIGPFRLEEAVELDALDRDSIAGAMLPAATAVAHLPSYRCTDEELDAIRRGRSVRPSGPADASDAGTVAVLGPDGELACLAEYSPADDTLAPRQVFVG